LHQVWTNQVARHRRLWAFHPKPWALYHDKVAGTKYLL